MKESQRQPHSPSLPSRNHCSPPAVCHAPRYDTQAGRCSPASPLQRVPLSPTIGLIVLNPLLSSLRSFARKLPASLGKEMDTLQAGKFPAPSRTPAITRSGAEETQPRYLAWAMPSPPIPSARPGQPPRSLLTLLIYQPHQFVTSAPLQQALPV